MFYRQWNEKMLEEAYAALMEDLPLHPSAPGGMIQYRRSLSLRYSICTAICIKVHNLWNRDFRISRQLGNKHICENVVFTKNCFFLYFHENITCLSVGLLMICQVFSVSCKIVYRWVTANCCFMSDILTIGKGLNFCRFEFEVFYAIFVSFGLNGFELCSLFWMFSNLQVKCCDYYIL
jgi:hypothetical protein